MLAKKVQGAGGVGGAAQGATVAFVGSFNATTPSIVSIDISDPTNLAILDTETMVSSSRVHQVLVDAGNDVLYALGQKVLASYDISNPSAITLLDSVSFTSNTGGFVLDTNRQLAFVTEYFTLHCFDISDPTNITSTDTIALTLEARAAESRPGIDTTNDLLFVPQGNNTAISVYDVSNSASLALKATKTDSTNLTRPTAVVADETINTIFVCGYDSFPTPNFLVTYSYNTSTGVLTFLDSFSGTMGSGGLGLDLDLSNDVVYRPSLFADEIATVDVSNTSSMSQLDVFVDSTNLDAIRDVRIDPVSNYAYGIGQATVSGTNYGRFSSVDASDTTNLSTVDTVQSTAMATPYSIALR